MGLEDAKGAATPGIKRAFTEGIMDEVINDDVVTTTLAKIQTRITRVKFSDKVDYMRVVAYSEVYPLHPQAFVVGKDGKYIPLTPGHDSFTGICQGGVNREAG